MVNKFYKSAWIQIKKKTILVTRAKGNKTFFLPGGGIESGEIREQTLIREIKEELSVTIKPESIQPYYIAEAPSFEFPETINICMYCFTAEYKGTIKPAFEIEEIAWFDYKDKDKTSHVDKLVFDYLKSKNVII